MLNPTLQVSEHLSPEARVVYAVLPPHAQASFTSITPQGSIGVSFTGHRRAVREYAGGPVQERDIQPGAAFLTMSSSLTWLKVAEPADALEIHYESSYWDRAATRYGAAASIDLHDVGGEHDPVVWGIAALFRAHLRSGRLLSDLSASEHLTSLSAHLLQTYAGLIVKECGPTRLDAIRLRRVDEYIESELSSTLTISRLAEVAALSPFHFARVFRASMGLSPHVYVTAKRMERARHLVSTTSASTANLANLVGFTNVAHFRAAFREFFGTTPAKYRAERNYRSSQVLDGS